MSALGSDNQAPSDELHSSLVITTTMAFFSYLQAQKCKLRRGDIINLTPAPAQILLISGHKSELISLHGSALV